jgi:hypothetical protein
VCISQGMRGNRWEHHEVRSHPWDHKLHLRFEQATVQQGFPQFGETLIDLCSESRTGRNWLKFSPPIIIPCMFLQGLLFGKRYYLKQCGHICYMLIHEQIWKGSNGAEVHLRSVLYSWLVDDAPNHEYITKSL